MSSSQPPPEAQTTYPAVSVPPPITIHSPAGLMALPAGFQHPYVHSASNGVPFVPFPTPNQVFESPRPEPNRAWEISKMVLHGLSVVLAAAGVGLGFSSLHFVYFTYTITIFTAPPCVIAIVWGLAELVARVARKFKAGIHPGAHVAVCLVIFLVGVTITSLFGPWFQNSWYGGTSSDSDSSGCGYQYSEAAGAVVETCNSSPAAKEAAQRLFNHEQSVSIAAAVVTYLVAAINFVLFVGACVDTARVNAAESSPIYVIVPPAMAQTWQPMPQGSVPMQSPVEQTPLARDVPPTEGESTDHKGKGKEPARDGITEQNEASGSQS